MIGAIVAFIVVCVIIYIAYTILNSDPVKKAKDYYQSISLEIPTNKLSQSAIADRLAQLIPLTNNAFQALFKQLAALKSKVSGFTPYPVPAGATTEEKEIYNTINLLLTNIEDIASKIGKQIDTYNIPLDSNGLVVVVNGVPSVTITLKDIATTTAAPAATVVPAAPVIPRVTSASLYGEFMFGGDAQISKNGQIVWQLSNARYIESQATVAPVTVYIPDIAPGDIIKFKVGWAQGGPGKSRLAGKWKWSGNDYWTSINTFNEMSMLDQDIVAPYDMLINQYISSFPTMGAVKAIDDRGSLPFEVTWTAPTPDVLKEDNDVANMLIGTVYGDSGVSVERIRNGVSQYMVPHIRSSRVAFGSEAVPFNFAFVAHSGDIIRFNNYFDAWGGAMYAQWTWKGKQYTSGRVGNFREMAVSPDATSINRIVSLFDGSAINKPRPFNAAAMPGLMVRSNGGSHCGSNNCAYTWVCP